MNRLHLKYVLIGGGLASSSAAQAIRALDPEGSLTLIGQEVNRPYNRPQLSKDYLRNKTNRPNLYTLPDSWFAENHVELRTGRRAAQLDPTRNCVFLDNGDQILFDKLLLATGGSPKVLKIPGAELPNVYYLRTIDDANRLGHAIEKAQHEGRPHDKGRGKVAVTGGGLLGVELAATFTQLGLAVDLILTGAHPWFKFAGETTGRFIAKYLEQRGVHLHASSPLRLEGDGRVQRVILSDQSSLDCDFVVPAVGMVPHKELLRGTNIASERAILVDEHCRTTHPDIYAAGDCAAVFDPLFGKYRLMDHWNSASDTGKIAGQNMAGLAEPYAAVNQFSSQLFDLSLTAWGESRHIERRILRGTPHLDSPDFVEIGLSADGRVSQVLALNHASENDMLAQLVRRRLVIDGNQEQLKDPQVDLSTLLK